MSVTTTRSRALGAALALVSLGCGSSASLTVEVKTDAVSGIEFRSVETEVASLDGRVVRSSLAASTTESTFATGVVVADVTGITSGEYRVTVRLMREDGTRVLLSRTRVISIRGRVRALFVLDRACFDRVCPDAGGGPGSTECAGGSCVDPRCVLPEGDLCEGVELCAVDADCDAPEAGCASSRCVDGLCFAVPVEGACGDGTWCEPEVGCRPFEPEPVACGTECARTECEVSIWRCEGAVPTCEPYLRPSAGASCADGVCDGIGRCGECPASAACNVGCRSGTIVCSDAGAECVLDGGDAPLDEPCSDEAYCVEGEPCAATGICTMSRGAVACLPDEGPPRLIVEPTRFEVAEGDVESTSVRLSTAPEQNVTVRFAITEQAALVTTEHVFGPGNWFVPHRIDVRGVVDGVVDGDQPFTLELSSSSLEARFDGLSAEVGGVVLDRAPRCGDGFVDATEICDEGAANGGGCGLCLAECNGFEAVSGFDRPREVVFFETDFDGSVGFTASLPPSYGGNATQPAWTTMLDLSQLDLGRVGVFADKRATPGDRQQLFARMLLGSDGVLVDEEVTCGVLVRFSAELEARSPFAAAGLRVMLHQRLGLPDVYVDSPRGTGNPGDPTYLETYIDVRAPFGPRVEGEWFFDIEDLFAARFDFDRPIYPSTIVTRSTVEASTSVVWFDDVTMELVYDRDRDGICDDVDTAICGNGVVEGLERCDPGCRLRPGERADCVTCP